MKAWVWVAAAVLVLAACGCLKFEQTITLNKDGSGEAKVMYAMSEQNVQQMKAAAEMAKKMAEGEEGKAEGQGNAFEFDQAKVEEQFKKYKDLGITLKSASSETKDGWQFMNLVFDFQDISKLKNTDIFKDSKLSIVKNADGNYVISSPMGGDEMGAGAQDEEQMKAMLPMLKGMRLAITINTPGEIIETTAPIKDAKSASWVFDVDKDPDGFLKMSKSDVKIVFNGKGCTIPEVKPAEPAPAPPAVEPEAAEPASPMKE